MNHRIPSALSVLLFFLLVPFGALHADGQAQGLLGLDFVESELHVDEKIHIGDPITYTVVVEHLDDIEVSFTAPPAGSRWEELHRDVSTELGPDQIRTEATITYAVFRPGPTQGPPIKALALSRGERGQGVEEAAFEFDLPPHPVEVLALTADQDQFLPPDGPLPIWKERSLQVFAAAGAGALFLLALLAFLLLRRRQPPEAGPPLPCDLAALQALHELCATDLLQNQEFKLYYLKLSEILRRYLGRRFDFPGTEWTTTEIVARLRELQRDEPSIDADALSTWLRRCDRVKFAGYQPTLSESQSRMEEAIAFVEATRPPEITEEENQATNVQENSNQEVSP